MHDVHVEHKLRRSLRSYVKRGILFPETIDQLFVGDVVVLLRDGCKLMFCASEDLANPYLDQNYALSFGSVCAIQNAPPRTYCSKFYTTSGCIDVSIPAWKWPILKLKT